MRYFLIDKVTRIVLDQCIHAKKAISLSDPVLHDHFPGFPVLPGALILEGVAQAAGMLLELSHNRSEDNIKRAVFAQVDKYKMIAPSTPGEILRYEVELISTIDDAGRFSFKVVEETSSELRATGFLLLTLKSINTSEIAQQRASIYKIWTKGLEKCPEIR